MNFTALCFLRDSFRNVIIKISLPATQVLKIMKLTTILLIVACLQVSATGHSQNVTLSMKDAPLQKVFREINRQTGFQFFYKDQMLKSAGKVSIEVNDVPVKEALKQCFNNLPITFEIIDNTIVVKERPATVNEQLSDIPPPINVSGVVKNEKGEPVAGASVTVKGTQKGTTTNDAGFFELRDVDKDAVLVVSGTNIETVEIKLGGRTSLNISTRIKVSAIDEVQIIGYGTTTKRLNTGAIANIKGEEIKDRPVSSLAQALQGKMPGLVITSNVYGGLGTAPGILIRGVNSITSGTSPMIIVDGAVVDEKATTLNFINPSDIETIDVLKDAAATGIYGSRGTNGVILITTKKATLGKTKLSANISTGWKTATGLTKRMNTQQYLQMRKDAFAVGNMASPTSVINPITPTPDNAPDLTLWDQNAYTNFPEMEAGNPGPNYNAALTISGGTKSLNFVAAAGYFRMYDLQMWRPYQERMNGRFQLNHTSLDNKFNFKLGSIYGIENQKLSFITPISGSSGLVAAMNPPNFPLYQADGSLNMGSDNSIGGFLGGYNSLVNESVSSTVQSKSLVLDADLSYSIVKGLIAKMGAYYSVQSGASHLLYPSTAVNSQDAQIYAVPFGDHSNSSFTSVNIEPQISYVRSVSKATVTALAGATFSDRDREIYTAQVNNPGSDGLLSSYAAGQPTTVTSDNTEEKFQSVFARISTNWDKKYMLDISYRRDGSSRFGTNNRWANFATIGLGWIFTSENFFKDNMSFLSYGKLKGSYGTTGNNNIPDYQYLGLLSSPPTYVSGAYPGYTYQGILAPSNYPNPDIRWETTTKGDIGLELGFLKNRIMLSAGWYRNTTTDLLVDIPLAPQSGFDSYYGNFPGVVQNTGLEFEMTTQNLAAGSKVKWTSKFVLSNNKNILKSFPGLESSSYATTLQVGRALVNYGTLPGIEMPYHFTGIDPATGLPQFEDLNKDGDITYADFVNNSAWIGSSLPTLYGGLTNTLSYKGFSLEIFLQYSNGIFAKWNFLSNPIGTMYNPSADVVGNYWMKPGDVTKYPRLYTNTSGVATYINPLSQYYRFSTACLYRGYYLRLKNVQLNYSLPARLLGKLKMSNATVFISGENLAVYTPEKLYQDPEVMNFNSSPTYGLLRTITTGIRVEF